MAEKVLLIKIKTSAEGVPQLVGLGRHLGDVAKTEDRLERQLRETNREAAKQQSIFGGLSSGLGRFLAIAGGAGAIGILAKKTFDYNQELEGTQLAIAGLLFANQRYVDSQGNLADENTRWQAAQLESIDLMQRLQEESLKTAATVPQIGDAFATVYGALQQAKLPTDNLEQILALTTRLTQTANAFKVPMEQIRQEVTSLLTGQITQDSLLAKRLGFTNEDIRNLTQTGTLVEQVMQRTEAYGRAAEAQANTVLGKLRNTAEAIVMTLSGAFDPLKNRLGAALDGVFEFFRDNKETVAQWGRRAAAGIELAIGALSRLNERYGETIKSVLAGTMIIGGAILAWTLLSGAIALATAPLTIFTAKILILAAGWEAISNLSGIEVDGVPLAGYVRAVGAAAVLAWSSSMNMMIGAARALWNVVQSIFGGLAEVLIAPLRKATEFVANMPDWAARLIPGGSQIRSTAGAIHGWLSGASDALQPGQNFREGISAVADTIRTQLELLNNFETGLQSGAAGGALMKPSDLGKKILDALTGAINGILPQVEGLGKQTLEKLLAGLGVTKGTSEAAGTNLSDAQQKQLDAFLAKIEGKTVEAEQRLAGVRLELQTETQRQIEDERISLIRNGLAREHAEQREALRRWADDRRAAVTERYDEEIREASRQVELLKKKSDEVSKAEASRLETYIDDLRIMKEEELELIDATEEEKREILRRAQQRQIDEQNVGTTAWLNKLRAAVAGTYQKIADLAIDAAVSTREAWTGAVEGFLDDLANGQGDLMTSFTDLGKSLGQVWTRTLAQILTNGGNVVAQLKDQFAALNKAAGVGGWEGGMNAALGGLGMGAAIGGAFGRPNTYGAEGGMVGGVIGGIIGYFAGGNVALGAAIGSAIGTALGSTIQKGEDEIRVAIKDGIVSITEKGISATAARDVQTQVQRSVDKQLKGWQSILDLFPETMKERLDKLVKPFDMNPIGAWTTVEGVIDDAGALGALSDFLGDKMPRAAFSAYEFAIRKALEFSGVGSERIKQLFEYWGTLQGQELQDAVRGFVVTFLEGVEWRDKFAGPFSAAQEAARKGLDATALTELDSVADQMAMVIASMSKLTDVEDLTAAQQEVNRLAQEYWNLQEKAIQRVIALERNTLDSLLQQREQIQLTGMDDQGKIDHYYSRLEQIREQLAKATNPEEISRLTQQMQQYISLALGIAPDNAENRDKLTAIIDDITGLSQERYAQAMDDLAARQERPALLLEEAARMLMQAAADLNPPSTPETPPPGTQPIGGGGAAPPNKPLHRQGNDSADTQARVIELAQMLRSIKAATAPQDAKVIADAVRSAIEGMTMVADVGPIDASITGMDEVVATAQHMTVTFIRHHPDSIISRSGG